MYYQTWNYPGGHSHDLYQFIHTQQEQILRLESMVRQLQQDIQTLKSEPASVHYKFDQLKVERLEGTLNIGITPQQENNANTSNNTIEDFSVNQDGLNVSPSNYNKIYHKIQYTIHDFLNHGCYPLLESLEQHYAHPLDNHYRQFILQDVKNQIDQRIAYYLQKVDVEKVEENQLAQIEEQTVSIIKEDIHRTLEEFLKHLPREGY